ncbi:hypothetical protein SAMN05421788_103215 [Filimonas lacunae]|uniref:Outer membrane transport energization protein TonB n=1 Tax=Filimonas lacunae TaxID=477680 RepID=A0A173MK46_9BACT|nr:hypothetical protein [Filimonas lacunae]BAV07870.1 ferric siderophore transport system, periplasmic binding protein TonB [Filimonas lacunae]SIT05837.1 hypothetical protein SAMN05421788_103215 [Filimonas lacunae]
MDANFESQKNMKALGITLGVSALLALLLFLVSWTLPQVQPPQVDQGIEVNLGNSDEGLGDIPPAVPGDPAEEAVPEATPPPPQTAAPAEAVTDTKVAEDNNDADATPVNSPEKTSVKPKPTQTQTVKTPKRTTPKPTVPPTPKPPVAKALYGGGKPGGTGGNGADSYNGVTNQGIAGGHGDQGKANGTPNSDSYSGNGGSGKSGFTVRSGLSGRKAVRFPTYEDDFNENAKVAVDITVNAAGAVIAASINPKGTTTTNSGIKAIAINKAKQLKFNTGTEDQTGTIVFDFKLKG